MPTATPPHHHLTKPRPARPPHRGQTIRRGERVAAYSYTGLHLWGYGLDGTVHGSVAQSDDGCTAYFASNDGTVYRVGQCPVRAHDEL